MVENEPRKKKNTVVMLSVVVLFLAVYFLISLVTGNSDHKDAASISKSVEKTEETSVLPEENEKLDLPDIMVGDACFHMNPVDEMATLHTAFYDKYRESEVYLVEREIPESIESFSEIMGSKIAVDELYSEMRYFTNEDGELCSASFKYDCIYKKGNDTSIYSLNGYVCDDKLECFDLPGHTLSEVNGVSVDVSYTDIMYPGKNDDEEIPYNDFLAVANYQGKYYYYYIRGVDFAERYANAFCKGVYENLVRLTSEQ